MKDIYIEINKILIKARYRLFLKRVMEKSLLSLSISLGIGLFLALLSRVIPIYQPYTLGVYAVALGQVIAIIYTLLTMPSLKKMALIIDSYGLKERVSTALEFYHEDTPFTSKLKEDALEKLKALNYKEKIKFSRDRRVLIALSLIAVLLVGDYMIPNGKKEEALKLHELRRAKKEEVKKIEKAEKELEKNKELEEEDKKAIKDILAELKKELKEAKNSKDIDKAMEKSMKKLELSKKENLSKDLKALENALGNKEETKPLAEALKNEDKEGVKKELEDLKEKLKNMDEEEKKELKDMLQKAAGSMSSEDLKGDLSGLSDAISSSDENSINSMVNSLSSNMSKALSEANKNGAVKSVEEALGKVDPNDIAGNQGSSGNGNNGAQGNQGSQGNGQGSGSGEGNGSGNGSGSGGAGAGSGSGTGGGVNPYGNGGIANKGPSEGKEKEYEKIYAPNRLGGEGSSSGLTGSKNNGGSSEQQMSKDNNALLGELLPYDKVIGEYEERAMERLNSSEVPDGMMDLIKEYFSSLQQ